MTHRSKDTGLLVEAKQWKREYLTPMRNFLGYYLHGTLWGKLSVPQIGVFADEFDWIVKNQKGEFSVVKENDFPEQYESLIPVAEVKEEDEKETNSES